MKQKIINWFASSRNFVDGVKLYETYGHNRQLKNTFNKGESPFLREVLEYELGKLAGITEADAKVIKPGTAPAVETKTEVPPLDPPKEPVTYIDDLLLALGEQLGVSVDDIFTGTVGFESEAQAEAVEKLAPKYKQLPELVRKTIRIREQYPFLKSPDCPNELKVLVADMFTAYDTYREAHANLSDKNTRDENLELAALTVESYLENRAIWAELDHYKENNSLLGEHPIFEKLNLKKEAQGLSLDELTRKLKNVPTNITKANTAIANAKTDDAREKAEARLAKWEMAMEVYEDEVKRRDGK